MPSMEWIASGVALGGMWSGVLYTIAKKKGFEKAYDKADRQARQDLKVRIGMLEYEDHIKVEQGIVPAHDHHCGETCRAMMQLRIQNARNQTRRY
jgi:hypothetical protein